MYALLVDLTQAKQPIPIRQHMPLVMQAGALALGLPVCRSCRVTLLIFTLEYLKRFSTQKHGEYGYW